MCFFVNFSFNNGSFPLQIPAFHFLLSSSSLRSYAHFSHRPLKLRSTIATDSRLTFLIRAAGLPFPHPGDSSLDEDLQGKGRPQKQHGSSSSEPASSEGKTPSPRPSSSSSSLSGNPSTSSDTSATITFTGVNQLVASSSLSGSHVQSCSCDNAGGILPSAESSPLRFKKLSHMSKGIKAAFEVFEGWKVIQKLHTPEVALLSGAGSAGNWVLVSVKATKFFAKGLKVSQKVLTSSPFGKLILKCHPDRAIIEKLFHNDLPSLARGFNAFYAAVKIAQFTKSFGKQSQEGKLSDPSVIWKGYKFSKSLVSILDVVAGKNGWALSYMGKGFLIVKKTMGGIGVMVKAVFLSKEFGMVVLKRLAISGGTFAAVFGLRQTSNQNLPTSDEFQQSKLKEFLCMTLVNEGYLRDLPSGAGLFNDESLFSSFLLVRSFIEDSESVYPNYSEEDGLTSIFCLALPLPISEAPAFA
ncbi:hypothetical protein GOP47_0024124 [Adiantum capillus-veneris]|uniref:Uncharacterized protein n=1 Tax=Adiantum capillus-veneris TaxID=13818 RepID=A0A9D4U6X5_ADICA|nr:hypothetical protein GOP47_0024124 [Adiantum capillus-veneris]